MVLTGSKHGDAVAGRYLLYSFGGWPVVAVPAIPRRLRRAALRRFQPFTVKRAAYRATVTLSMLARVDSLFSRSVRSPLDAMPVGGSFDWERWLEEIRSYLGGPNLGAAVFWPTALSRSRLYVHLFDGEVPVAFAKISVHPSGNARLSQEAQTLRDVHGRCPESFRAPRLLKEGSLGPHAFLLLEPLPTSARPIRGNASGYPAHSVQEYAGPARHIPVNNISALSWWGRYVERLDNECRQFHVEMTSLLRSGVSVCRAHGDLSRHNIAHDGRVLWIYDWEESVQDAPLVTDLVGFALSLRQTAVRAKPALWAKLVRRRLLENGQVANRAEIMMALAFRHSAGIDDATHIIKNWGTLNETP